MVLDGPYLAGKAPSARIFPSPLLDQEVQETPSFLLALGNQGDPSDPDVQVLPADPAPLSYLWVLAVLRRLLVLVALDIPVVLFAPGILDGLCLQGPHRLKDLDQDLQVHQGNLDLHLGP